MIDINQVQQTCIYKCSKISLTVPILFKYYFICNNIAFNIVYN